MLKFIKVKCGHCSNNKWWKEEILKLGYYGLEHDVYQYTCLYCGYIWWE